jgi:hypothetical protein
VIELDEFRSACRAFTDTVFGSVLAGTPAATVVLEKTPDHAPWAPEILSLYPDAAFVHVVRDPRDVVCSLRSAGRSWGRHWAPTNVLDGALLWRDRVEAGLRIRQLTSRYHEVRYEDLQRDAAGTLDGVCEFLGLPAEEGFSERAAEACRMDRLKSGGSGRDLATPWGMGTEPAGFFRAGRTGTWRDELTPGELRRVEYLASPLMSELGYGLVGRSPTRRPLRVALREGLEWRHHRLYRTCRRWLQRL